MLKIATALDRPPSQYFKKWIDYNTQLFDKECFVFINFFKSNQELEEYLLNKGFKNILTLTVTKTKWENNNLFEEELNNFFYDSFKLNKTIVIHCDLDRLVECGHDIYFHFIHESKYLINKIQYEVIQSNQTFIFLDSDEILIGENLYGTLQEDFKYIIPKGYNLTQNKKEIKLNWGKSIHKQRSFWKYDPYFYNKPIIVNSYLEWGPGRHAHHHADSDLINIESVNSNIILFHLRDVCFDYLYDENQYSHTLYPIQTHYDHRIKWDVKEEYNEWILERQEELEIIPNEIKVLLEKYNI